jgi:hypothetical protein
MNWRNLVKMALFSVLIEGAIRKWFLPQSKDLIYFLKDFFLLGAYISYFILNNSQKKVPIKDNLLIQSIFFVTVWCTAEAFNSSLGSPLVGLMGLKGYLWNIPLIWLVPNLFNSERELFVFLRNHLLLAIPICILGIIQFFSPASDIINNYATDEVKYIATIGSSVRITGTFSYLDTYVVYLTVAFGLLLALIDSNYAKKGWKIILLGSLFLVAVNSLMTGSRSCVFASILFVVIYIFIKALQTSKIINFLNLVKKLIIPLIVVTIAVSIWFQPAIETFSKRTTGDIAEKEFTNRVANTYTDPVSMANIAGLYGYGAGATQQASLAIRNRLNLPTGDIIPVGYEEEPERILLEIGLLGFIFWYSLKLFILIKLWLVYRKLKRPFLKQLALSSFLIQLIQFTDQLVTHHVFSFYYWFLTGFIFLLPRLEKIENLYQLEQFYQQDVQSKNFTNTSN